MLFSENFGDWVKNPRWVDFLLRFGYGWSNISGIRRIGLVSMPCDSPAAGLIALGALIRDLHNPDLNDCVGHYEALLRYAHQYLKNCRRCTKRCDPKSQKCGFFLEATGRIDYYGNKGPRHWMISDETDFTNKRIAYCIRNEKIDKVWRPDPLQAWNWQIQGEPPVNIIHGGQPLPENIYDAIIDTGPIISDNLIKSYSGLCFSGRAMGENATRMEYSKIRFRNIINKVYTISDLLTIKGWSGNSSVSRMTFFNPRTQQIDRRGCEPALVIADGDSSFLKVLDRVEFQRSDIIGVINRVTDREKLESISDRMQGLGQWYIQDSDTYSQYQSSPLGISWAFLKRRTF